MRKHMLIATALAVVFSTTPSFADDKAPAAAAPVAAVEPPKPPAPKALTLVQQQKALELLGGFVAMGVQLQLEVFGFTNEELDILLKGVRRGALGEDLSRDENLKDTLPLLNDFLRAKAEAHAPKMRAKAEAKQKEWDTKNADFLRNIDKDATVKNTPTGLRYKIITPGGSEKPTPASIVKARYTGKLVDGTVFDSTKHRGDEPTEFPLSGVIRGWTEGLQKIGKGGKILLYLPSDLAYGDMGSDGRIPPKSVLEFEVELVDFSNAPEPAAKPEAKPEEKK
jgi:FKBP-type peptidyl-prolyl cis-trans isomerase